MDKCRTKYSQTTQDARSGWFWIAFCLLLVCGAVTAYALSTHKSVDRVISGQLSKLKERHFSEAYYEYSSPAFQKVNPLQEFKAFILSCPAILEQKSSSIASKTLQGNKAKIVVTLLSNDNEEARIFYSLVRNEGDWKIQKMNVIDKSVVNEDLATTEALEEQVEDHLLALRDHNLISAYYDFFAKDFQNETPFGQFCDYIESHPVLTDFDHLEILETEIDENRAIMDFRLHSDEGTSILRYRFQKAEDGWKIWNLQLTLSAEESERVLMQHPGALEPPIRYFLDALLKQRSEEAYDSTAREFQEITSLSTFENFIHDHPVLQKRDLTDIKMGAIENDVGRVRVNLHDSTGLTALEFKLGYEIGQWRIWGIEVLEAPQILAEDDEMIALADSPLPLSTVQKTEVMPSPPKITDVSVGDTADEKGVIQTALTTLDSTAHTLFFNVNIENGVENTLVTLSLTYVEGNTEAPALSTKLSQKGATIIAFSYNAPKEGWPPGNYLVKVTLDSGEEKIQRFEIRENTLPIISPKKSP